MPSPDANIATIKDRQDHGIVKQFREGLVNIVGGTVEARQS